MASLEQVLGGLRALAPEETALDGDPVGLLIAPAIDRPVKLVGVCLDATPEAVARAVRDGVDLVVAHHPLIYRPIKRISPETDGVSASIVQLIQAGIGLWAMHTNWDLAPGGINDTLAGLVGLTETRIMGLSGEASLVRIGNVAEKTLGDFCALVAKALGCDGTSALRVNEIDPNRTVRTVAVCGGAGGSLMNDVIRADVDTYVTADVRHHEFVEATARGLALIDAGHGATERPGMRVVCTLLPKLVPGLEAVWLEA